MASKDEPVNPPPPEPDKSSTEPVPDPDEDDLDDLDDMLDEFSTTKLDSPTDAPSSSGPGRPTIPEPDQAASLIGDDDFAKQLQAGMADLLGELDNSPEMQAQFESFVREFGNAGPMALAGEGDEIPSAQGTIPSSSSTRRGEASFQETIQKTMQRMEESGQQAEAAVSSDDTDDPLAEMLKQMQSGGLEGAGNEEDFSKMLLGMMEQLTNKEILYEPMKELHEKYPGWIENNKDQISKEDLERYTEQRRLVQEIVVKFEENDYSDSNATDREYIVERMQKMQAAGSPPPDLVGDMNGAQEALGDLDAGCPQQ